VRDEQLEPLFHRALSRCYEPRSGERLTCGICSHSVGQQVDIFAILLRRRTPISRDSLSQAVG
jgi:hypothetical protein